MMREKKGSITIEATFVLCIFIIGFAAVTFITSFIRAQMIIQYSISEAAKEISSYCYIAGKTSVMSDSAQISNQAGTFKNDVNGAITDVNEVIDTVGKLYQSVQADGKDIQSYMNKDGETDMQEILQSVSSNVQGTVQDFNAAKNASMNLYNKFQASEYKSNPVLILKGMANVAMDEGFSAIKLVLASSISRALVKGQIEVYGISGEKDILERLGVVDGFDGLDFSGSTLFNDGKTILVTVTYDMRIPYLEFADRKFHYTQRAATKAWGSDRPEKTWRTK